MKNKKVFSISRRPFLAGLASAAGAAVFIRPILAEAQTGQAPKRFFAFHYPCGTILGNPGGLTGGWYFGGTSTSTPKVASKWLWLPTGSGASAQPNSLLNLFSAIRTKYATFYGLIRGDKDQKVPGDKHTAGMVYMMSGYVYVPMANAMPEADAANAKQITSVTASIDQQLLTLMPAVFRGPDPAVPGSPQTQFASIQLCASPHSMLNSGSSYTCLKVISYTGKDGPMGPEARSAVAFNNIFGGAMMPGVDPAVLARQQAQKKSVLDFVMSDIQRLQPMVPVSQRPKLDAQLTSIRNLEARIAAMPPPAGQIVPPKLVPEPAGTYEARARQVLDNQLAIIRCAFQSDLTRVATFSCGHGNNEDLVNLYFQPPPFTFKGDGHACSHNGKTTDALAAKGEVAALFLGAVAKMFGDMDVTLEAGGTTLLDNTLGIVFSECSDGDPHSPMFPLMTVGGKWIKMITGGQHLLLPADRYINDFWIAALNALNPAAPVTTWGDPLNVAGPLPGIFG